MIKIFCLYYKGKYTPDYIEKLYNGLKRNCKVPFEFICYSDTDVVADKVIPLPKDTDIKEHWHKLRFFDKEFAGEGDIIVMDIDQVIVSDITQMIDWPVSEKELVSYDKWWTFAKNNIPINGGWYKFKSGSLQFLWDKYNSDPNKWQTFYYNRRKVEYKYFGEQNFVYDTCVENSIKITKMPGEWVAKYDKKIEKNSRYNSMYHQTFGEDYMIMGGEVNEKIKIIHFANFDNAMHLNPEPWIKDYWK